MEAEPRLLAGPADLDMLELVAGGALDPVVSLTDAARSAIGDAHAVVLHDAENTPLARLARRDDGRFELEPLQALAPVPGAAGASEVRSPAREFVARRGPGLTALLAEELPTRGDLDRVRSAAATGPVVVLVPAGRASRLANGLVRAWRASLDEAAVAVDVLALPWTADAAPAVIQPPRGGMAEVVRGYGVSSVRSLLAERGEEERDPLGRLGREWDEAVAKRYPAASARELARPGVPTANNPGAVVLFTGLSGSGKSTLANVVAARLGESGSRPVVLLDGDEVRQLLSAGLGFDAASRAVNVQRIGYVASIVASCGGIALAAPIAPFAQGREEMRRRVERDGTFVLVHVSTPLDVCEARDRKGLYAKARRGEIPEFTGISSPYEAPLDADLVIDTSEEALDESAARVLAHLAARGLL